MRNYTHNTKLQRFEFYDQRFYTDDDGKTFFPSVTHVLNCFPKGEWFETWLKSVGMNADQIKMDAADAGTNVHNAIDQCLKGDKINLVNSNGNPDYTKEEWKMIQRFGSFWESVNPKMTSTELNLISKTIRIGGTLDLVCDIYGKRWLIDHKTSNGIQDTHYIQLAVYAKMWNEAFPDQPIERCGILWLKASTRGESKTGKPKPPTQKKTEDIKDFLERQNEHYLKVKEWEVKRPMQGHGWQIKELTWKKDDEVIRGPEAYEEYFNLYKAVRYIWNFMNPNFKPFNLTMSDHLKIKL
jgi:hypothetical protein